MKHVELSRAEIERLARFRIRYPWMPQDALRAVDALDEALREWMRRAQGSDAATELEKALDLIANLLDFADVGDLPYEETYDAALKFLRRHRPQPKETP